MKNGVMRRVRVYLIFNTDPNSEVGNQLKPIIVKGRLTHPEDCPFNTWNKLVSKIKYGNIFSCALQEVTDVKCNYLNYLKTKF